MEVKTPIRTNELRPDFLSINSLNPWTQHDSSSRGTMFSSSHIGQCLVINGCTPRRCQSGTEREFGKYTFSIKMPTDARIIKVIPKYRTTSIGAGAISHNPTDLIIYEDVRTKQIGIVELVSYSTATDNKHQHFGFKYRKTPIAEQIGARSTIPFDTVLADSPAVDDKGNYCYGVESNVAFMSVPSTIEDGVVVSKSYLKKITSKGFEKRVINWGEKYYPLNLYGGPGEYKPFPDIGDKIRDDGLVFALRAYDDLLGPVEMDPQSLREPDYIFDKLVYGEPGATVVDINVHHDTTLKVPPTPVGMEAQAKKYADGLHRYYTSILETYNELHKLHRESLDITPEFHRLVVEAMGYVGFNDNPATKYLKRNDALFKRRVQKLYRRNKIDDWRVEVSYEYDVVPTDGFKLTDCHGGKGVICAVWDDEDMPVDAFGNRAEIIMDGDATIKRMNIGRLYEQYLNAASRDVSIRVREMANGGKSVDEIWKYLLGYYWIVSPRMATLLESPNYKQTREQHIQAVIDDGVYLWIPTDNPADSIEMIQQLRAHYPPNMTPVTYAGGFVTDRPALIGSLYIIVLEKTGADWTGVSSAKLQHFGIPARVSNADRYATPGRNNPVRILGEAEVRLINAVAGSDIVADLLDQSNSPATHKAIVNAILSSEKPTAVEELIDREEVPLGNSRSLLFVKHILECAGIKFVRRQDDPIRIQEIEEKKSLAARAKEAMAALGNKIKNGLSNLKK